MPEENNNSKFEEHKQNDLPENHESEKALTNTNDEIIENVIEFTPEREANNTENVVNTDDQNAKTNVNELSNKQEKTKNSYVSSENISLSSIAKAFIFLLLWFPVLLVFFGHYGLARLLVSIYKQVYFVIISVIPIIIFLFLLSSIQNNSKKYKGWKSSLLIFCNSTPIVKELFKAATVIVDPFKVYKDHLKKNLKWFGAIIFSVFLMNMDKPILSKLKLPPEKETAAASIYMSEMMLPLTSTDTVASIRNLSLVEYIIDTLRIYKPNYFDLYLNKTNSKVLREVFYERFAEKPQYEYLSERYCTGLSILQLILEHDFKIKTSDDIRKLLGNAPQPIKDAFEKATKKEEFSLTLFLLENLITVTVIVAIGFYFGLVKSKRKRDIKKSIAACAYMFAAVYLFYTIVFAVLGKVTYLFIAVVFSFLLSVLYTQVWLLVVLPTIMKISPVRTFFFGNIGFILIQIVGLILENYYWNLNLI